MSLRVYAVAITLMLIASRPAWSQPRYSPLATFAALSASDQATTQLKLTTINVGGAGRSVIFHVSGEPPRWSDFAPFRHDSLDYSPDDSVVTDHLVNPIYVAISGGSMGAIVDSLAALAMLAGSPRDSPGHISIGLIADSASTAIGYEALLNSQRAIGPLRLIRSLVASDSLATAALRAFVCYSSTQDTVLATDVTASTRISFGAFRKDRRTGFYVGSVRVTNTSASNIPGPVVVVLPLTTHNAKLLGAWGLTCAVQPYASSILRLSEGALGAGAHVERVLWIENPFDNFIDFYGSNPSQSWGPRVFSGAGEL